MMTKPSAAIHGETTNSRMSNKPRKKPERGHPDAAGQMGVEVGPADLFDQTRILPREALLDLLEDPLFVLAEGHPFP